AVPLDLEHMAALIEFEDDAGAVEALTQAARENRDFAYTLRRLRYDRAERKQLAEQRATYVETGVQVIDSYHDLPRGAAALHDLWGAEDGQWIREKDHRSCPGHVMAPGQYIGNWTAYCLDPAGNGHRPRSGNGAKKADPAAMRAVVEGNKDWVAATDVRRDWLLQFTRRKTWPKTAQEQMSRFAAQQVLLGGDIITQGLGAPEALELARQWLGLPETADRSACAEAAAQADPRRLVLHHFVAVAATIERQAGAKDRRAWRTDHLAYPRALRERIGEYLRLLETLGYQLSPIERAVASGETHHPAREDAAQAPEEPQLQETEGAEEQ
ncbi:hypothetical protein D7231_35085, partial [Streptomyces klenkii]